MTTVDAARSPSNQGRALGTVAGVAIALATVVVGAQALGETPSGDFSYRPPSYQCVWPVANPVVPQGHPISLALDKPRCGMTELQPAQCLYRTPTPAPDPMRVPAKENMPPQTDFQPTSQRSAERGPAFTPGSGRDHPGVMQ